MRDLGGTDMDKHKTVDTQQSSWPVSCPRAVAVGNAA